VAVCVPCWLSGPATIHGSATGPKSGLSVLLSGGEHLGVLRRELLRGALDGVRERFTHVLIRLKGDADVVVLEELTGEFVCVGDGR
jgi:hypothetical protein